MLSNYHFLRPWWLLALIPWVLLLWQLWSKNTALMMWQSVCDKHLLDHLLIQNKGFNTRKITLFCLFASALCMILSLAGPTWSKLPVPTYHTLLPRVALLDMSRDMLLKQDDFDPLMRAKFKLHDLFTSKDTGQWGLIAYTSEPFIVSPVTEDAKTIDSLLESLTPGIMPVGGQNLSEALEEGKNLLKQAGFNRGQLLVFTATTPDSESIAMAESLAKSGLTTSIVPIVANEALQPLFAPLANAGKGKVFALNQSQEDLAKWLKTSLTTAHFLMNEHNDIPVWRDEGPWLVLIALLWLLPVFRRGWLQRINT